MVFSWEEDNMQVREGESDEGMRVCDGHGSPVCALRGI